GSRRIGDDRRVQSYVPARAPAGSSARKREGDSSQPLAGFSRGTDCHRERTGCGHRQFNLGRLAAPGDDGGFVKYRKLGSSDLNVSEISLGSWLTYGVGVERDHAAACVNRAFELGINFIDTANAYGRGA